MCVTVGRSFKQCQLTARSVTQLAVMCVAELDDYLELARAGPSLSDEQHIFNKLIFDAVNEAINECIVDVSPLHLDSVSSHYACASHLPGASTCCCLFTVA